ncbi:MFS transporter [Streptosporangium algeriense]|uniref:histidine kinase n=1 Tax=Streptosporangium algeriense TaxID=1682748 RepID=A0ABW3DKR6_9ACTN
MSAKARPGGTPATRWREEEADPRRWKALTVCLVSGFMTLLDVSIVNVALPAIRTGLDAPQSDLQWVVSGYALTFGLMLVPAGRFGDMRGRRNVFVFGVALFTLASAAAGIAGTSTWLVLARLVQGVAGGIINPQVSGLIQQLFRGAERMRVQLEVARDVHDVVGHALGVTLAQSGVVLSLPDVGESELRETLAEVETHTRRALEDVQALVRTLRDPDGGPGPGLDGIAAVITATRAAGIDVETRVGPGVRDETRAGPGGGVETRIGLGIGAETGTKAGTELGRGIGAAGKGGDVVGAVAFRVVQEALGNVVRHAPGATCVVDLHRESGTLVVRVEDGGAPAGRGATRPAGAGVGLRGMRERVRLVGGTVTWGTRPEGGFAVEARLPFDDQDQAAAQGQGHAAVQGQDQAAVQGRDQTGAQERDRAGVQGQGQAAVQGRDQVGARRRGRIGARGWGLKGGDDVR